MLSKSGLLGTTCLSYPPAPLRPDSVTADWVNSPPPSQPTPAAGGKGSVGCDAYVIKADGSRQ